MKPYIAPFALLITHTQHTQVVHIIYHGTLHCIGSMSDSGIGATTILSYIMFLLKFPVAKVILILVFRTCNRRGNMVYWGYFLSIHFSFTDQHSNILRWIEASQEHVKQENGWTSESYYSNRIMTTCPKRTFVANFCCQPSLQLLNEHRITDALL